ncbi:MAG: hypothetical protein HY290_21305 [Planctomycetia bacterium]|nr:hypothetical protein [Planctomycetia bacterium]
MGAPCQPAAGAPPAASAANRKAPTDRAATRAKPFEPEKLVRAFRGRREDVRLKALDEIEHSHLTEPAVPGALWQAIEPAIRMQHVPDSLLYALKLYGKVDDRQNDRRFIALLAAADLRIVMCAVDLIGERRPADSLPALIGLREHREYATNYGLRHAVVSAVARFSEPASVDFLVSTIGAADGQLKYVAALQLARLTGENFGGKGDSWKEWWQSNREDYRVAAEAAKNPSSAPLPWDYAVPQFYGAPVYAKRVVFVLDRSKSMLSSVGSVVRLEDACQQLEKAVRALPEDSSFEIIAYNDTALPFAGRLVQATPQAKSDAVRFMYSQSPDGKTASFDALAEALRIDSGIEAILYLSDGDPNTGTIVDRVAIVAAITQQNQALRAAIDTIGIDARGASEEFLKKLASENFGSYRSAR